MITKLTSTLVLAIGLAGPALARPPASGGSMLIHGNYCGPGNNAPLAPIDALDAACARHDACTPDGAPASKACNLRLQRDAESVARDPRQREDLKAMATFISAGAALMPSAEGLGTETVAMPDRPDAVPSGQSSGRIGRNASHESHERPRAIH